tara:strand:+ start:1552 stop:2196 length:645 start_codon:yes stop_codon:yes gene_type:complete
MSSLALSAAPFTSNNEDNNLSNISNSATDSPIERSRRRRTIKNRADDNKVNSMMSYIHKNLSDSDDEDDLNGFNPPEPPTSIGAERRKETDPNLPENKKLREGEMDPSNMSELQPLDEPVDSEAYEKLPDTSKAEYYEKIAPLYQQLNEQPTIVPQLANKGEITQKLNYMIHLLEEQHDERTGHVFEELILYSFLGIFIIFVVDSFARAGKYVR